MTDGRAKRCLSGDRIEVETLTDLIRVLQVVRTMRGDMPVLGTSFGTIKTLRVRFVRSNPGVRGSPAERETLRIEVD